MKIVLGENECITVRECSDLEYFGVEHVYAYVSEKYFHEDKKGCFCNPLPDKLDVDIKLNNLLVLLADISTKIETRIKVRMLSVGINKFCDDTQNRILIYVTGDKKDLRFDVYDPYENELLKQELTLDEIVDYIDEFNKRKDVTV